jgi:hypothetical protein
VPNRRPTKRRRTGDEKIAAIIPTARQPSLPTQETVKLVQAELRRVGCFVAPADGDWNALSQRSLSTFNKYAGTKFDPKLPSFDALDAIKAKSSRVCPLICDRGFKANADTCVKITCRPAIASMTTMHVRRSRTRIRLPLRKTREDESQSESKAKLRRRNHRSRGKSFVTTAAVARYGLDAGLKALVSPEELVQTEPLAGAALRLAIRLLSLMRRLLL